MVEEKAGLECKWKELKMKQCSPVKEATRKACATCCEDEMFYEGHNASSGLEPHEIQSRLRKCQIRVLLRVG